MLPILTLFTLLVSCRSQWILSQVPALPHDGADGSAVASYDGAIFLLGGYGNDNKQQLVTYDIANNNFTDDAQWWLGWNLWGMAQYYTQLGDILYAISYYSMDDKISMFNMATTTWTREWSATMPIFVGEQACLTATSGSLYVVGGFNSSVYLDAVQMLDISTQQWTVMSPLMNEKRARFSCIITTTTNALYAIGGLGIKGGYLSSIEYINTNNMPQQSWTYTEDLTYPAAGTRCVLWQHFILVIGGYYKDGSNPYHHYLDTVHVIDTITNKVSVSPHRLRYSVQRSSAIVVDNILYVFGGECGDCIPQKVSSWMTYDLLDLPTNEPSKEPTDNPTSNPSYDPSKIPTLIPTYNPTYNPTLIPTFMPTSNPTSNPTLIPTLMPTYNPTSNPSGVPTIIPTDNPTSNPTLTPTNAPSTAPTAYICDDMVLQIMHLEGMTAYDLAQNDMLQSLITNATKFAIHDIFVDLNIYTYFVHYEGAFGNINIAEKICTFTETRLNIISSIIASNSYEIAQYIKHKLVEYVAKNGVVNTDNMTMIISMQEDITVTNTSDLIDSGWIIRAKGENCGDGYTDLDDTVSIYYGEYCQRCNDDEAGINGKCHQCGSFEKPNHLRTDCYFVAPWWLYVLCTILVLICIMALLYVKCRPFDSKQVQDTNDDRNMEKEINPEIEKQNDMAIDPNNNREIKVEPINKDRTLTDNNDDSIDEMYKNEVNNDNKSTPNNQNIIFGSHIFDHMEGVHTVNVNEIKVIKDDIHNEDDVSRAREDNKDENNEIQPGTPFIET